MLTLLLGLDDFSKTQYLTELAKQHKAGLEVFGDAENLPNVDNLLGQDLFSQPKVYVLRGLVKFFGAAEIVEKFVQSKNQVVIVEEKLDKRLAQNKELLKNKDITVKEYNLPHGQELNKWVADRIKFYGGTISKEGTEALAAALGRDDAKETKFGGKIVEMEEIYNLWQADGEVKKLIDYAAGKEISAEDVKNLVTENGEVEVFDLTNAIADNEKQKAMDLLHRFLKEQVGADEKGAVIQLNALLSEQFRNVAVVQDFLSRKIDEDQILEATGWKSGRLFVMKKVAGKFAAQKVLELLNKLAALDEELKTGSTPPKVLLDLIVSQLLT